MQENEEHIDFDTGDRLCDETACLQELVDSLLVVDMGEDQSGLDAMGVGDSTYGSEHPNPTQPQSRPSDTRSTHPFDSDPAGHSARNPTHKHSAPHIDPGCRHLVT